MTTDMKTVYLSNYDFLCDILVLQGSTRHLYYTFYSVNKQKQTVAKLWSMFYKCEVTTENISTDTINLCCKLAFHKWHHPTETKTDLITTTTTTTTTTIIIMNAMNITGQSVNWQKTTRPNYLKHFWALLNLTAVHHANCSCSWSPHKLNFELLQLKYSIFCTAATWKQRVDVIVYLGRLWTAEVGKLSRANKFCLDSTVYRKSTFF
jgi:hypothetical protein